MIVIDRKIIGTICLAIGMFINPLGFDILVYKLIELTKSYWTSMFMLYSSALLFFGLSVISFKLKNTKLGNVLIAIALFLNPLGYDLVVYLITLLTNSYWITTFIMYILAIIFFGLYFYFYGLNPIKMAKEMIIKINKKEK